MGQNNLIIWVPLHNHKKTLNGVTGCDDRLQKRRNYMGGFGILWDHLSHKSVRQNDAEHTGPFILFRIEHFVLKQYDLKLLIRNYVCGDVWQIAALDVNYIFLHSSHRQTNPKIFNGGVGLDCVGSCGNHYCMVEFSFTCFIVPGCLFSHWTFALG
jgi:hypothetical protein